MSFFFYFCFFFFCFFFFFNDTATTEIYTLSLHDALPIQRPVQAIVVDPRGGHAEQILERRRAVPVLRDVQLARWLTQARDDQHRRHLGPRDRRPRSEEERGAQRLEAQRPPQRPAEPDIAKRASPLDADSLEPHRDGRLPRRGPFE